MCRLLNDRGKAAHGDLILEYQFLPKRLDDLSKARAVMTDLEAEYLPEE